MQLKQTHTGLAVAVLFVSQASCHFLLNYPNTIGFDDDNEGTAPCGGFNVTFDNTTDFHVDGDAIALTSTHPQADWLFRATLDKTATGDKWTDFLPIVSESGLGAYCQPSLSLPGSWAGQSGVIQVIQNAVDGLLYQCAAISFVTGKATSTPSSCKNATGLSAAFTTDASLPASAVATAGSSSVMSMSGSMMTMTGSMTMSGSSTGTAAAAPSASKSASGAVSMNQQFGKATYFWSSLAVSGLTLGFIVFTITLNC